jgi:RNA polymerase sigma-70 factor (ECF subfamily)
MRLQMTVAETGPCVQAMEAGRSLQSIVKESGIMSSIGPDTDGVDFNTVYSDFYPKILRYLARLVGPEEAEDVSQEVFIKISRSLGDYRGEGLSSWVYRIATNAAMDRRRRASPIAIPAEEESMTPDSAETAEQHLIRGEMSECVRGLIDALPDTYRAVLILSEIEGLADAEIASVVGATLETVKIRLHRARRRLREALVDHCSLYHDGDDRLLCDRKAPAGH